MKFTISLLALLAATVMASPLAAPEAEAEALAVAEPFAESEAHLLSKRTSCKVVIKFWPDKTGTCIDVNKTKCTGTLKQGLCPGASNIICCY